MDFAVRWNGALRDGMVTPHFPRTPLFLSVPRSTLNGYVGLTSVSVSFRYSPRGCHLCSGGTRVSFRYAQAPKRYPHCSCKET